MMCQRTGRPPISSMGFGTTAVSSARRVPRPPARMTTFTVCLDGGRFQSWRMLSARCPPTIARPPRRGQDPRHALERAPFGGRTDDLQGHGPVTVKPLVDPLDLSVVNRHSHKTGVP